MVTSLTLIWWGPTTFDLTGRTLRSITSVHSLYLHLVTWENIPSRLIEHIETTIFPGVTFLKLAGIEDAPILEILCGCPKLETLSLNTVSFTAKEDGTSVQLSRPRLPHMLRHLYLVSERYSMITISSLLGIPRRLNCTVQKLGGGVNQLKGLQTPFLQYFGASLKVLELK